MSVSFVKNNMKLCLGTVQFGLDYGVQAARKPELSDALAILNKAYNEGITMFDTARAYGGAESVLGAFLAQNTVDKKDIKIISKASPECFSSCAEDDYSFCLLQELKKSLDILGVDSLDGYLFHNPKDIFDAQKVYALYGLKEKGLVRSVGVSVYTPEEALKALEYKEIDIIQVPYNILDRRLDKCDFWYKAAEKGIRVFARSALLQGLLTMDVDKIPTYMSFAQPTLHRYHSLCKEYRLSPFQLALGYVVSNPAVDYVVFGVDNIGQLSDYLFSDNIVDTNALHELDKEFHEVDDRILMPSLWHR